MTLFAQTPLLLIEDDEGHATLIAMNLREAGLTNPIEHIVDGQTALEYVEQHMEQDPAFTVLILLDLNLPVVDGFGVLQQLKTNPNTRKYPVIVFTSSDDDREIERCYALGCNAYLRKPIDYSEFVHTIHQLGSFISVIALPAAR
ncbi:MAG: response regulator [Anaerolineae bacterium]|nr:response regulator [Anaerolineae bacterium]